MDFPIHNDTISMGLPILYFKGSQKKFPKLLCISVPEDKLNTHRIFKRLAKALIRLRVSAG